MKILNKKFFSLIGIILIIIGIAVTTILTINGSLFITKAGPGVTPKDVRITNISDSSFTVSYLTDEEVVGTLDVGSSPDNLNEQFLDDRDQLSQSVNKYKVHSITVRNLNPNTSYSFLINSGDQKFSQNNYSAKTGSVIEDEPTNQNPITGKLLLPDGNAPADSIVYLNIGGAQKFSTLGKKDGSYTFPLNSLRKEELDSYYKIQNDDNINLEAFSQNLTSTINVSLSQANPIPTVTLSNSYSFAEEPEATQSSTVETSFPQLNQSAGSTNPSITSPKSSEAVNDSQPEFEGTAPPNETVEIEIHSDEAIKTTVKSDSSGNWTYRPSTPLSPGSHTITITSKNSLGIIKTITQNFTVYAAGTQVEQTATPSATISITPTPSPTPSPTPLPSVSPAKMDVQATPIPTLPPTGPSSIMLAGLGGIITTILGIGLLVIFH